MIQGLIVKMIFNAIYKAIQRKHNLKKIALEKNESFALYLWSFPLFHKKHIF